MFLNKRGGIQLLISALFLFSSGWAQAKGPEKAASGLHFSFQVVTPKLVKEQAGCTARTISYGKAGKSKTVVIHFRADGKQTLADWAAAQAPQASAIKPGTYVGVWYVENAKNQLVSRVFFSNLKPLRPAESHKLADGSGEEDEAVFTYDAQRSAKGPIDKSRPLPF